MSKIPDRAYAHMREAKAASERLAPLVAAKRAGWTQAQTDELSCIYQILKGTHGALNSILETNASLPGNIPQVAYSRMREAKAASDRLLSLVGTKRAGWTPAQTDELSCIYLVLKGTHGALNSILETNASLPGNIPQAAYSRMREAKAASDRLLSLVGTKRAGWTQAQTDQLSCIYQMLKGSHGALNSLIESN